MRARRWSIDQLKEAVRTSPSVRQVLFRLGLKPAGGNYHQVQEAIRQLSLDTSHFLGKGWSKGVQKLPAPYRSLEEILVQNSSFQSYKLKQRLFQALMKKPACEECGWAKAAEDGRIPVELDHINGDNRDNRLENLRILCPNCHSLQSTHRGKNKARWRNW